MKILVVVQARIGSSRLPGKVLLPLAGRPLLVRMLERLEACDSPFDLVVATTCHPVDDVIRDTCRSAGVECLSGHPSDLLDRHYRAALAAKADVVVKIPSDCPLIDPRIVGRVLIEYLTSKESLDYVSNLHPATYPDGNDVEVMSIGALETAFREATRPFEREHTSPFLWERPQRFRMANVLWETGLDYSMSHRFTIDYPADYRFIKAVYDELWTERRIFGMDEILSLLVARPDIFAINQEYAGVNWYRHHLAELTQVTARQTKALEAFE